MTQLTMGISYWEKADAAFERGQQAYLDWCREIAKLYAEGTATQEEIAGRYQKERQRITTAIAIGSDDRIVCSTNILPKSSHVLYLLTTLPDKDFEELCKPTTTQAVILEHKRRLAVPKDVPPPQRPPCPGAEGIGPGCWKWSEGMEEWVQQPAYVEPKSNKLTAEDIAAHEARVKANQAKHQATFDSFSSSLKSLLNQTQQHMPAAILDDASPIEYLTQAFATMLQYGGAPAAKLAKQMFSSAYHPDSGKVRHDASLMGSINKALSFLEK